MKIRSYRRRLLAAVRLIRRVRKCRRLTSSGQPIAASDRRVLLVLINNRLGLPSRAAMLATRRIGQYFRAEARQRFWLATRLLDWFVLTLCLSMVRLPMSN